VRRHLRLGSAGLAAVAAAVLAAAGCSSSSSSPTSTAAPPTSPAPATSLPPSTGTGGQGAQSVTNYLTYTDGKSGAASSSMSPVDIGFLNQQGGSSAIGPLATNGAQTSQNVLDLQKRVAGVLPIAVNVPHAGNSYRFVRPLVVAEETRVTFNYRIGK